MPKQRPGTWRGPEGRREAAPLPDLTGVALHVLRDLDEPMLLAAVDEVLCSPGRFSESWRGDDGGKGGEVSPPPPAAAAREPGERVTEAAGRKVSRMGRVGRQGRATGS